MSTMTTPSLRERTAASLIESEGTLRRRDDVSGCFPSFVEIRPRRAVCLPTLRTLAKAPTDLSLPWARWQPALAYEVRKHSMAEERNRSNSKLSTVKQL